MMLNEEDTVVELRSENEIVLFCDWATFESFDVKVESAGTRSREDSEGDHGPL